jgi:hypothetical protein
LAAAEIAHDRLAAMTIPLALFLSVLLQISTPGPQINRQEDLRRQTETSVSRRVEDDRKFVLARSAQTFRENTARLSTEVDEICACGSMLPGRSAR